MAGGKGSTFSNNILKLFFQAVGIPNIADNASASPLTTLYVSLHTADPGAAGSQNTTEAAYTGYARVGVARTSSGWTVTGNVVNPTSAIAFPTATGGSETETFAAVGTAATGAGEILYRGPLTPNIVVTTGVTPQVTTTTALTES